MQGRKIPLRRLTAQEQRQAIEDIFDYRGDVTLVLDDDSVLSGFIYDRHWDPDNEPGTGAVQGRVRLINGETGKRETVAIGRLIGIAFTGRDNALGKSWKTWLRKCREAQTPGQF